ncbi:hypothetical protein [Paenibacillus oryzisoli]|nr:hypothetical protein [Paenibacillus oryzisoli]
MQGKQELPSELSLQDGARYAWKAGFAEYTRIAKLHGSQVLKVLKF